MRLPQRPLSRRAVKQFFDKIPEARWEYWFRHEKENGLHELRSKGPFEKAYYDGMKVREWLLAEGHYHPKDLPDPPPEQSWTGPLVALAA